MTRPTMQVTAQSLRSRARAASYACVATALIIPALVAIQLAVKGVSGLMMEQLDYGVAEATPSWVQAVAACLMLLPAFAMSRSLFAAGACLRGFAEGDWFGTRQPNALAACGTWLFVSGFFSLVMPTLLGLMLTLAAPPGQRMLSLSLSSATVIAILFGALIWCVGRVWEAASALAQENEQFV